MADSEVADHDRARVLAHLSRCAGCLARLDAEHATKDAVSALSVGVPRVPGALQGTLLALGSSGLPGGSDTGVGVHHGSVGLPRQRTGMRPGAVGVFSVLGLGLGIAAAAVLPAGPAPASTIPVRPIGPPASALPAGVAPSDSAGAVAVLPAALTLPPPAAQTTPTTQTTPATLPTPGAPLRAALARPVTVPVSPDPARLPGQPARATFVRSVTTAGVVPAG